MRVVDVEIQRAWLSRRGLRGRWITAYLHRYAGREHTERLHSHPWALAFGVVLKGRLCEVIGDSQRPRQRGFLSVGVYRRCATHRIVQGDALTLFIGLLRTQVPIRVAAEVLTDEGYCHYTELMPDEPGFNDEFVSARSTRQN